MIIAVPSKNRAMQTTTDKILPDASFYVPKSEVHNYSYVKNVIAVPDEVKGITKTRNWILNNTHDKYVVFLDDDVKSCGWVKLNRYNSEKLEIKEQSFWVSEFRKLFDMAEGMDYKIWGIKTENSTRSVYPYKPFNFRSYVTASCMGIVNDGEFKFDESFAVKEDYEICLRHILKKGGILAARYLHWENAHWVTDGGCKDYRTMDIERDATKRLIEMYPNMIRSAQRNANVFTIQLSV